MRPCSIIATLVSTGIAIEQVRLVPSVELRTPEALFRVDDLASDRDVENAPAHVQHRHQRNRLRRVAKPKRLKNFEKALILRELLRH